MFPHRNIHKYVWTYFNILNRSKNNFSQLFDVHNVGDVRQIEQHAAEPIVPGISRLKIETAIAKMKKYILSGNYQILAELFQAGCETPR
jgi:hypothetical protein